MSILEYVKLAGTKYMAWATKQDVENAVKDIDTSDLAKETTAEAARVAAVAAKSAAENITIPSECSDSEIKSWFLDDGTYVYDVNGTVDDNGYLVANYTIDENGIVTFNS